ncbi:MAG: hypothetical protein ACI7YS_05225 [Flavobacterium sp.]
MTCQKINFNKAVALLFLSTLSILGYSQQAEKIYHEEYSKLSFVLQPSILKPSSAGNYDGSTYPTMDPIKDFSYQFGFYYNFAQSGSFNFKTGVIAKEFVPKFNLYITGADIGNYEVDYLEEFDTYNQFIISIPFKTEYFLKLHNKLGLSLGVGLNLDLFTGMSELTLTRFSVYDNEGNGKDIFYSYSRTNNIMNFSTETSIGLNYKTKFAFFDLSYYTTNIVAYDYTSGNYQIVNLLQSPDKKGAFTIYPFYYGLSLVISPKKNWIR